MSTKPKCLSNLNNFDSFSTETDTPKNEKTSPIEVGSIFKFPLDDSTSSESGSKRNSIQNEERPSEAASVDMTVSQLMLCHFGQELHEQSKSFNRAFYDLQKLGSKASRTVEESLPLRQLFLQDYSCLEKMLVLINVVLFAASFSCDNVDQEVSAAILYIMFAIGYFVVTTTCLSGASSFKNNIPSSTLKDNSIVSTEAETTSSLTLILPETISKQGANTKSATAVAGKK